MSVSVPSLSIEDGRTRIALQERTNPAVLLRPATVSHVLSAAEEAYSAGMTDPPPSAVAKLSTVTQGREVAQVTFQV